MRDAVAVIAVNGGLRWEIARTTHQRADADRGPTRTSNRRRIAYASSLSRPGAAGDGEVDRRSPGNARPDQLSSRPTPLAVCPGGRLRSRVPNASSHRRRCHNPVFRRLAACRFGDLQSVGQRQPASALSGISGGCLDRCLLRSAQLRRRRRTTSVASRDCFALPLPVSTPPRGSALIGTPAARAPAYNDAAAFNSAGSY